MCLSLLTFEANHCLHSNPQATKRPFKHIWVPFEQYISHLNIPKVDLMNLR